MEVEFFEFEVSYGDLELDCVALLVSAHFGEAGLELGFLFDVGVKAVA